MQRAQLVWAADRWIGGVAHFPGPRLFPVKEAKNMTESEYQWQIRANEARISEAAAGIAQSNRELEQLQELKVQLQKMNEALVTAARAGKRKINRMQSLFAATSRMLRGSLFPRVAALYEGQEYVRSCAGLEESIRITCSKMEEVKQQIEMQQNLIYEMQENNSTYRQQMELLAAESEE